MRYPLAGRGYHSGYKVEGDRMKVVSLSVGGPRTVEWNGETVLTSIFKTPVDHRLRVTALIGFTVLQVPDAEFVVVTRTTERRGRQRGLPPRRFSPATGCHRHVACRIQAS